MKKISIFAVLILFCASGMMAQSNKEKANTLFYQGYEMCKEGNLAKGIQLIEEAVELEPDNYAYSYELCYFYTYNEDYKDAIEILEKLKKHKDVEDLNYQLLGNCYDFIGKPEKATETYLAGLKLFPKSGKLYLELGNMETKMKRYEKAVKYYEKGIEVEPIFPSNFYNAAVLHLNYGDPFYGLMYGEIFINLEKESKRTVIMSNEIYKFYKRTFYFDPDSGKIKLKMYRNEYSFETDTTKKFEAFTGPLFLILQAIYTNSESVIDLESICRMRARAVKEYYKEGINLDFYNVVYEWQNFLLSRKLLNAYNHYILIGGNTEEFERYYKQNKEEFDSFVQWFKAYDISINLDTKKLFKRLKPLTQTGEESVIKGVKAFEAGNDTLAIKYFSEAIEKNPDFAGAYYGRGISRKNIKDYENAISDFSKAIELKPEGAQPYKSRGGIYVFYKEYEKALSDFNKAIELQPDYGSAYQDRANIVYIFKEYEKAISDFTKAAEYLKDSFYVSNQLYMIGFCYLELKDYENAIKYFTASMEFKEGALFGNIGMSFVYFELNDLEKAIAYRNKAFELEPQLSDKTKSIEILEKDGIILSDQNKIRLENFYKVR